VEDDHGERTEVVLEPLESSSNGRWSMVLPMQEECDTLVSRQEVPLPGICAASLSILTLFLFFSSQGDKDKV
jgi:hypothetical protein